MILGRTASNAIKIKTDGGLRAVNCACCETGPCNFPPVCLDGVEGIWSGDDIICAASFAINGCGPAFPFIVKGGFWDFLCQGNWVFVITGQDESSCYGIQGTWFFCKDDGIDSPVGSYSGYAFPVGNISFNVTEKPIGGSC